MSLPNSLAPDRAVEIARDGYIYAYPLVLQYYTARQATNAAEPRLPFGPINQVAHARGLPGPELRIVIRPNVDTLYSSGYLDLSGEPQVLTVPATDRYFMMPLYDAWSNVFAVPGTRTTGPGTAREFLLVAPDWHGQVPDGLELLRAPTALISMIARTRADGEADLPDVHKVQDQMKFTPLSRYGDPDYVPPRGQVDPAVDMTTPPPVTVTGLTPAQFLDVFTRMLLDNPPAVCDYPIRHQLERIGLRMGEGFDWDATPPWLQEAITEGFAQAQTVLTAEYERLNGAGRTGWVYTAEAGSYGVNYLLRAGISIWGLGMNLPEDAIYPSLTVDDTGRLLDGAHRYTLRFEPGKPPPVHGFWSVTAYDAEGYLIPNTLRRYALGDRSDLTTTPDGAIELHVQADNPGPELESNWLPVQPGPFNLMLRLYSPGREFLTGQWTPPPLLRVDR